MSSATHPFLPVFTGELAGSGRGGSEPLLTFDAVVRDRVMANPLTTALIELGTSGEEISRFTFAEINARADAIAAALTLAQDTPPARSGVVLSVERHFDFLCGLIGIIRARRFVVPILPPRGSRHAERANSILSRASFGAIVADKGAIDAFLKLRPANALPEIVSVADLKAAAPVEEELASAQPSDLAVVQYTSGSTRQPRGVMLTHANLLANLDAIRKTMELRLPGCETIVSWLPPYHDMGLVGGFLNSLYLGATLVSLPTNAFLRRPLVWLEAVSRYGATLSGAPNFAYQLCADTASDEAVRALDLSRWRVAFNGAEPVSARTCAAFVQRFAVARFSVGAMYPCYGMAEVVVMATGGKPGTGARSPTFSRAALKLNRAAPPQNEADVIKLIGCGRAVGGHRMAVVAPQSVDPLEDGQVGELMLAGPSVGAGYLEEPEATRASFGVVLTDGVGGFFRTGDLGFIQEGEIYLVGRVKDLVIVHGENHHPADLEYSVGDAAPELHPANCCAFADWDDRRETEGVVVVAAVRATLPEKRFAAIAESIQEALATRHGIAAIEIVLVKPGALPRTTSGKNQRQLCRSRLRADELPVLWRRRSSGYEERGHAAVSPSAAPVERLGVVLALIGRTGTVLADDLPLERLGLDSIDRVRLMIALEDEFAVHFDSRLAPGWKTIGELLAAIAVAPKRRGESEAAPEVPPLDLPTAETTSRRAEVWRDDILRRYNLFQDITGLTLDNPVQVLRVALAMDAFPGIGRGRAVLLAQEWVRREQLTGWFYHVPRVEALLANPEKSAPDIWWRLCRMTRHAPGPAVVTLFHTAGWNWLLALLLRAAADCARPVAVLYDPAVAELSEVVQKRFDVLIGRNSRSLRASGAVVLVDIRDPNLEFTLVRLLDEKALLVSMPDAVHGGSARAGVVEVPYLGGSMRLASGLYRIAAMRGTPLYHLVSAFSEDGPRVTIRADSGLARPGAEDEPIAVAMARQLAVFTMMLAEDPAHWRQWRALVPVPCAVPAPRPGAPWFDRGRFLVLDAGARIWLMCRISQRTYALPREAHAILFNATDECSFRAAVSGLGLSSEIIEPLIWMIRGTDPHVLVL